jgi:hypothetical protein
MLDFGYDVVGFEHVLVEQVAQRQIFGIVADRHHGDDLLRVQVKRQRAFNRDADLDSGAGMIDAVDLLRQSGVCRVRHDDGRAWSVFHLVHCDLLKQQSRAGMDA